MIRPGDPSSMLNADRRVRSPTRGGLDVEPLQLVARDLLPQLKSGYFQRLLFKQRYVCMFRSGHALDKEGLSVEFRHAWIV